MLKITSKVIGKKIKLLYNETVESLQIFLKNFENRVKYIYVYAKQIKREQNICQHYQRLIRYK